MSSDEDRFFEITDRRAVCGWPLAAGLALGAALSACGLTSGGVDSTTLDGDVRAADAGEGGASPTRDAGLGAPDGAIVGDGSTSRDATADGPSDVDATGTLDGGGIDGAGAAVDGGEAGAPGVRIVGRTTAGTAGPRFEWSGASIAARFTGTQVSIELNDGSNLDEFEVVVDGATLPNLVTRAGTTTYPLAAGLANRTHDLLVWRRTEAFYGFTEFVGLTGFSAGGGLLAPPPAPAHQIEIVGDSISCGYGIEGNASCTAAQLESIENNYLAYGSVAARALGADVVTVAWSGIGIYRNYDEVGPSTDTMPQRYDFSIPTDDTAWDFSQYRPQAVVVNLTANDFSTMGDPGQPYVDDFVAFVEHIRSKYAGAYIFLVIGFKDSAADSATDVDAVVSDIRAGGDTNVESFDIRPFINGNGCNGHPDVAGSQAMGAALAAEMKRVLTW
jgi:hypothetical protein